MTTCTPECEAEKAVLVEALKRVRHSLSPNELAVEAIKSEDPQHSHFTAGALMTRNLTYEVIIAIDDALADTSPAALLAQGEALKWYGNSDNWEYEHSPKCEESAPSGPCIADLACRPSCAAEKDEGRRARAALAPGEEKE